ncbi:MAG: AbrB/MazE/SpoVT family DNA-binding domain-containing protein [Candidatus Korobacteraceae bacterium]
MKTELVRIGNSRGIRIPKPIIEQCGFEEAVELRVEGNSLILSSPQKPRLGWREAFRTAGASPRDEILLDVSNEFDREEWTW